MDEVAFRHHNDNDSLIKALDRTATVREAYLVGRWKNNTIDAGRSTSPQRLDSAAKAEIEKQISGRDLSSAIMMGICYGLNDMCVNLMENQGVLPGADSLPCTFMGSKVTTITLAATAALRNNQVVFDVIKTHPLFYIDEPNIEGFTALHIAAYLEDAQAINMLLDAGADPWRKISDAHPVSAYDLCPSVIKKHPVFKQLDNLQERKLAKEARRAAFIESQEKLKRLAAGLPPDAPKEEKKGADLSGIFIESAEEEEAPPPPQPKKSREEILKALIAHGGQDMIKLYVAEEAKENRLCQAFAAVADKVSPVTLDKILVEHEYRIKSPEKSALLNAITQHDRNDLSPVFNYRLTTQRKFQSVVDYHDKLVRAEIDKTAADDIDGTIRAIKLHVFGENLQKSLEGNDFIISAERRAEIFEHMRDTGRPDLAEIVMPHKGNGLAIPPTPTRDGSVTIRR